MLLLRWLAWLITLGTAGLMLAGEFFEFTPALDRALAPWSVPLAAGLLAAWTFLSFDLWRQRRRRAPPARSPSDF